MGISVVRTLLLVSEPFQNHDNPTQGQELVLPVVAYLYCCYMHSLWYLGAPSTEEVVK